MRRGHFFLLMVVLALLWGIAFVAIKEVLGEVSFVTLTVLRFVTASVCLLLMIAVWRRARPRITRGNVARIVLLALLGVPGYHLSLNWGEQRTGAGIASLIVAAAPVIVAVASAIALREPMPRRRVAGIAVAFAGVAVLALFGEGTSGGTTVSGVLVTLLAPVSWASYTVIARPLSLQMSSFQLTAATMLTGTFALLPLVRAETLREASGLSAAGWVWVVFLGAGASFAGYLIFNFLLSKLGAARTAVLLYLIPIVALTSSWAILGERIGIAVAAAAALVIGGVWLAEQERKVT